jgi:hypothetical protein
MIHKHLERKLDDESNFIRQDKTRQPKIRIQDCTNEGGNIDGETEEKAKDVFMST